jgi:hypothetical protein
MLHETRCFSGSWMFDTGGPPTWLVGGMSAAREICAGKTSGSGETQTTRVNRAEPSFILSHLMLFPASLQFGNEVG